MIRRLRADFIELSPKSQPFRNLESSRHALRSATIRNMSSSPDCELDSNSEDDIELTTSPLRSSEQYEIHHDAGRDDRLDFIGTDALDVHTAGLAPKTARLPQSKDSSNTFESLASSSSVRPTLYHLYSHDGANAIDLTDVGPASDNITIKALNLVAG